MGKIESEAETGSVVERCEEISPLRLNLGAGNVTIPGYLSVDIKTGTDVSRLPYADASVDEVYASHVLEHFPYERVPAVVQEWSRVLKPGGIMRISVPDIDKLIELRKTNRDYADRVLLGGHLDEYDVHGCVFDDLRLRHTMGWAGMGNIRRFEPFADDCSKHSISLNLEGVKRWWKHKESPSVTLVLSQPRLGFNDTSLRLVNLAHRMQFNIFTSSGAFWDRDIEFSIQAALNQFPDTDYFLFCDYDGVFGHEDVFKLLAFINRDCDVAAVGAVQMSRHDNRPLVFDAAIAYSGTANRVDYSHFGLTLIRADVFRELPQPWFWSVPGQDASGNASWGEPNRSDADITFWRIMREHGFKVYQRNDVVIGHLVLSVKWPRGSGSGTMLQPIEMYNKNGRPAEAIFNPEMYREKMDTPNAKFAWIAARASGWQFGETGMLMAVVERLGIENGVCAECGTGDADSCPVTVEPLIAKGWRTFLFEKNEFCQKKIKDWLDRKEYRTATLIPGEVVPKGDTSIDAAMERAKVKNLDVLVLDVDSIEWYIARDMEMRPRVMLIENYDLSAILKPGRVPDMDQCGKEAENVDEKNRYTLQATWDQVASLMSMRGYTMVGQTRINGLYVRNDLVGKLSDEPKE